MNHQSATPPDDGGVRSRRYSQPGRSPRTALGLVRGRAGNNRENAAAELPDEQTRTVEAQPVVAPREVKREARPDPDKPGWGRTISL